MAPPIIRFEERSTSPRPRRWKVNRKHLHLVSALMSLVLPGAGQVYKGRIASGVAWLIVVAAAYAVLGPPGLLVHLMCVVTAGSAPSVKRRPFVSNRYGWSRS